MERARYDCNGDKRHAMSITSSFDGLREPGDVGEALFRDSFAVALVDYDNVFRDSSGKEIENVEDILYDIYLNAHKKASNVARLEIRLYGGWTEIRGQETKKMQKVKELLRNKRFQNQNKKNITHTSRLVTHLSFLDTRTEDKILGTFRVRVAPGGPKHEQKMVDGMLSVDAIHYSRKEECQCVMIYSDDDDILPAAIMAAKNKGNLPIYWIRRRRDGLNDNLCTRAGVVFDILRCAGRDDEKLDLDG